MKKIMFLLVMCYVPFLCAHQNERYNPSVPKSPEDWVFTTKFDQGIRFDHLKWSISGPHKKPNILSELDYRKLCMSMTRLTLAIENDAYVGKAIIGYGYAFSGKDQDSDYAKNNRKGEFSRSYSSLKGSYCVDSMVQFGKKFFLTQNVTFTPSLGYGYFMQHMNNGKTTKQVIAGNGKFLLHGTTYTAYWHAPYANFLFSSVLSKTLSLDVGYTFFYPVQYRGNGYWANRKEAGKKFIQKSSSMKNMGHRLETTLNYAYSPKVSFGATLGGTYMNAQHGTDYWKKFGKKSAISLKKVERTAFDFLLSVSYAF